MYKHTNYHASYSQKDELKYRRTDISNNRVAVLLRTCKYLTYFAFQVRTYDVVWMT